MSVESELYKIRTLLTMIWFVIMILFVAKAGIVFADIMEHIRWT